MGKIRNILAEREIGPGFYTNTSRTEIEESFHCHIDETRYAWNKERFLKMIELFKESEQKYKEMGEPDVTEKMHLLSRLELSKPLSHNRMAIEEQQDTNIHFHFRDIRIHINPGDFFALWELFDSAWISFCEEHKQKIDLTKVKYHPVVDEYINWLKDYKKQPYSWKTFKALITKLKSNVGDFSKRNMGLPSNYPKQVNKITKQQYLYSLYEDVKNNGIKSTLVFYKLKDGSIQAINSHRFAILKFMGYNEYEGICIEPESNWKQ